MRPFIAILLLILWTPSSVAQQEITEPQISQMIKTLVAEDFPELQKYQIKVGAFEEKDSFFQSNFEPLSLFGNHPVYKVEYNPRLVALKCPSKAVKAILAHELSHTLDYVKGGVPGIIGIGAQLLVNTPRYEHRTDLQAIFRGYGEGLIMYREWIYPLLTPEDLQHKKQVYYQPQEIELLMSAYTAAQSTGQKEALLAHWLAQVPMSEAEIYQDMRRFNLL